MHGISRRLPPFNFSDIYEECIRDTFPPLPFSRLLTRKMHERAENLSKFYSQTIARTDSTNTFPIVLRDLVKNSSRNVEQDHVLQLCLIDIGQRPENSLQRSDVKCVSSRVSFPTRKFLRNPRVFLYRGVIDRPVAFKYGTRQ